MNKTYYDEKLETLPENLQYAIIMSGWEESLSKIQKQFALHIDQTQVLEDSTMKLMFGDIDAPDFINHMFSDAHINSEKAADILLEVDLKILKKIRDQLQISEKIEQDEEEIENFLLENEEKKLRLENEAFAKYYAEVEKIREEDEVSPEDPEEEEIPTNIEKERDDLLNEINSPTKSFTLTDNIISPVASVTPPAPVEPTPEPEPIPVDHQLENTHIEKPFHEEDIIPELPKTETKPEPTTQIKKPIIIKLDDIYREPIE